CRALPTSPRSATSGGTRGSQGRADRGTLRPPRAGPRSSRTGTRARGSSRGAREPRSASAGRRTPAAGGSVFEEVEQSLERPRVNHAGGFDPSPPRGPDAVFHHPEVIPAVGIGADLEQGPPVAGQPDVRIPQVQPLGVRVDLE